MLASIIRNLISNAIKFTPTYGEININAVENRDYIKISVADSGIGIKKEKLSKLFKIGEKNVSTYGTHNEKGTGLGLILCKEFVEKHGGTICVRSEVGKGSTFTFSIPKRNMQPEKA